jgi:hypothetical protein
LRRVGDPDRLGEDDTRQVSFVLPRAKDFGRVLFVARPEPDVPDDPAEKERERCSHAACAQDRNPFHQPHQQIGRD